MQSSSKKAHLSDDVAVPVDEAVSFFVVEAVAVMSSVAVEVCLGFVEDDVVVSVAVHPKPRRRLQARLVEGFPVVVDSESVDVGLLVFLGLLVLVTVTVSESVPVVVVPSSHPIPKRLSHLEVVVVVVFSVALVVGLSEGVGFGVGVSVFVEINFVVEAVVVDVLLFPVPVGVCKMVLLSSQPIPKRLSHFVVVVDVLVDEGFVVECDFSVVWDDLVVEESFGQPIPKKLSHEEVVVVLLGDLVVVVVWICLCVVGVAVE